MVAVKVSVDENPAVAARYGITSIPAVHVFQGGEVVATIAGFAGGAPKVRSVAARLLGGGSCGTATLGVSPDPHWRVRGRDAESDCGAGSIEHGMRLGNRLQICVTAWRPDALIVGHDHRKTASEQRAEVEGLRFYHRYTGSVDGDCVAQQLWRGALAAGTPWVPIA